MILNEGNVSHWLSLLVIISALAFVFSLPVRALDADIIDRLPIGYSENIESSVSDSELTPEPTPNPEPTPDPEPIPTPDPLPDPGQIPDLDPSSPMPEIPPDIPAFDPDITIETPSEVIVFDPQQQMYSDIFAIRQCVEIIVYCIVPLLVGVILLYKFCQWFYRTFIESAWDK